MTTTNATSIHHTKISVSDMDRSLHFYCDVLGFKLIYDVFRDDPPAYRTIMGFDKVQVRIAMLRDENERCMIGLLQFTEPAPIGSPRPVNSIGFVTIAVEVGDIQAVCERIEREKIKTISPPVDIERDGKCVARAMYVFDPDGLQIELYQAMVAIEDAS